MLSPSMKMTAGCAMAWMRAYQAGGVEVQSELGVVMLLRRRRVGSWGRGVVFGGPALGGAGGIRVCPRPPSPRPTLVPIGVSTPLGDQHCNSTAAPSKSLAGRVKSLVTKDTEDEMPLEPPSRVVETNCQSRWSDTYVRTWACRGTICPVHVEPDLVAVRYRCMDPICSMIRGRNGQERAKWQLWRNPSVQKTINTPGLVTSRATPSSGG
jgi:hypothetical protein